MRRPRRHLEVSTFPFLAVLLCAMGSLILILMVFDRRAKLAANERNRLAAEALVRERQEEIDRLKAQKEQVNHVVGDKEKEAGVRLARSRELKKELSAREEELRKQLLATQKKWEELDRWIKESRNRLTDKTLRKDALTKNLESEKKEARLATEKFTQKQTEMGRLSSEIIALKKILEELKVSANKPTQTYSIIPYFGKKGETRKPIYVECQGQSFVFHPGSVTVPIGDVHQFRDQVILRAQVAQVEAGVANASVPPQPYLLLLVRPEGIENYWKAQAMLRNDKMDFGYELIDGDWKLEFPDDAELSKALRNASLGGSRFAGTGRVPGPGRGDAGGNGFADRIGPGPENSGSGSSPSGGRGFAPGGLPGSGAAPGLAGFGPGGQGNGNGIPDFPNKEDRSLGLGGLGGLLGQDVGGARKVDEGLGPIRGIPPTRDNDSGTGVAAGHSLYPGMGRPGVSGPGGSAVGAGNQGTGGRQGQGGGGPGGNGIGGNGLAGNGPGNGTSTGSGGGLVPSENRARDGLPGGGQGSNGNTSQTGQGGAGNGLQDGANGQQVVRGQQGQGGVESNGVPGGANGQEGNGGRGGVPGETDGNASGISLLLNPDQKRENQNRNEESPERKKPRKKTEYSVGAVSPGSSADDDDEPNPFARVAVPNPIATENAKKEPRPLRVARLDGNREFILFIECNQHGLVIHPDKQTFPGHELETEEGAKRLLAILRKQIDRKTKNVPKGEIVPRGQVRFLVRPEGLRWYHASFPIVEELEIQKTRQNLDPEDKIRDIILGN